MRTRTKIILHHFTRLRFDEAVVIRTDDRAIARHVDLSDVLGPCRSGDEGIASHNANGGSVHERVSVDRREVYLSRGLAQEGVLMTRVVKVMVIYPSCNSESGSSWVEMSQNGPRTLVDEAWPGTPGYPSPPRLASNQLHHISLPRRLTSYRAVTRPLVPALFASTCQCQCSFAFSARRYARAVASYAPRPPHFLDSLLIDSLPHSCSSRPPLSPPLFSNSSRTRLLAHVYWRSTIITRPTASCASMG
jgi:hypothetical protein